MEQLISETKRTIEQLKMRAVTKVNIPVSMVNYLEKLVDKLIEKASKEE